MKQYFINCETLDAAKLEYRKLVFHLHPDTSGYDSKADFQDMQNQFEAFTPKTEKFEGEKENWSASHYMAIIEDLMQIKGIIIEVIGSFIWLSGETYPVKDRIKAIENESFKKAQFSSTKKMWFFSPIDYKQFTKSDLTIEQLRDKYGTQTYSYQDNKLSKANERHTIYKQKLALKRYDTQFTDFDMPILSSHNANMLASLLWDNDEVGYRESFYCCYFNRQLIPICWAEISKGAISETIADIRIIFAHAFLCGATGLMAFHNHPSSSLKPSASDIELTRKIKNACLACDISFHDHIIVIPEFQNFYSFADEGMI
jgi:proteasome lid subunit RPN8/RPN11